MITPTRREALLGTASVAVLAAAGLFGCADADNDAAELPSTWARRR